MVALINHSVFYFYGKPSHEKVKTFIYVEILDSSEKTKHICPGPDIRLMPSYRTSFSLCIREKVPNLSLDTSFKEHSSTVGPFSILANKRLGLSPIPITKFPSRFKLKSITAVISYWNVSLDCFLL